MLTVAKNSAYSVDTASTGAVIIAGNSVPARIGKAPANAMTITWSSIVGKIYVVGCKSSFSDTVWTNLSGNITASNTITSYTDTSASKHSSRFYLVYATN